MMKIFRRQFLLVILAVLGIAARGFCFSADVEDISGGKYYPAVKSAIGQAEKSISMVMYQVNLRPYDKSSQVYALVDELVKAHNRGVKVKVILDQNIDFVGGRGVNRWVAQGRNSRCFRILKEAGIDVKYDSLTIYTHAKALVIDKIIVILGSANWSESAFNDNLEVNTLIKSKELAGEFLRYFKEIKIEERATTQTQGLEGGVVVSWKFLENPKLGGRMLTAHDERAFDLYLALLKESEGGKQADLVVDYEKIAADLGLLERMTKEGYRREINRGLQKLKSDYSLVDVALEYGKAAKVRLLSYDNPKVDYSAPTEWYFQVPNEYWKYGWARTLSQSAKFCYLINLAYVDISNASPWWFSSREVLAKRFNIDEGTISKGMQELRNLNLIDVAYDNPEGFSYADRMAKSYKILPLL